VLIFQQPRDFPSVRFNLEFHNYIFACISYTLHACNLHVLFQIIRVTPFLKLTIHESTHYATSCIFCLVFTHCVQFSFYGLRNWAAHLDRGPQIHKYIKMGKTGVYFNT